VIAGDPDPAHISTSLIERGFAIGFLAIQGEGFEIVGDGTDHVVDRVVSRRRLAASPRDAADFPINRAGAERRTFQRQPFGEVAQIGTETSSRSGEIE
jgi:hypothetical protein